MSGTSGYQDFLGSLLSDRERFFEEVVDSVGLSKKLNYAGLTIVGLSGFSGMYALHDGLTVVCEKRGVYPRKALTMMRAWAVLFAFVGVQLAWNLRPFLGDRAVGFQLFGKYEGNFYAAVVYAVKQLGAGNDKPTSTIRPDTTDVLRGLIAPVSRDSTGGARRP